MINEGVKLKIRTIQLYTTFLSLCTILFPKIWAATTSRHTTIIYLFTFLVFASRDLYPLITVDRHPRDGAEGTMLWVEIVVLFFVGVVIPFITPREYVPLDPKVERVVY